MPAEFRKDRRDVILHQSACADVREEGLSISRATTHLFSDPANFNVSRKAWEIKEGTERHTWSWDKQFTKMTIRNTGELGRTELDCSLEL